MSYAIPLYRHLANSIDARLRCTKPEQYQKWFRRHTETIENLAKKHLPHGSGIDVGATINLERSTGEKIVIETSFHHMDDNGFYDGWTDHTITITPSLISTISIHVSGKNRNDIKDHLADVFRKALETIVEL